MQVTLLMAMTLDGRIARNSDHFPDWTPPEDKKVFAALSRRAGVIIMGSRTFDTLGKPLPGRLNVVMSRDPSRKSPWENLVFSGDPPQRILEWLEGQGYEEVILAGGPHINSLFARQGLIDSVIVTVSPKIFGTGLGLFGPDIAMDLTLKEVQRVGAELVLLRYGVLGVKTSEDDAASSPRRVSSD
ncbi:dihydrofolate reductase [Desulfacinum hydrothermale DSM 13146]|uniref:Dihydrofolate reductase n=1 Tax=Desulfacinum hydrothermale DSM 13146 TaxID=1121390 RepID=A0A1W1WXZ3_9BACT|nr:dihydrofolate reductase family protein [Desulfacinum hydrothermale]SMC16450.1 dihydrofolate reductase [Desulfacinum hydrothermale DSM 13146]